MGFAFIVVPNHAKLYGDTYVPKDGVVPLEDRAEDHYEKMMVEKHGFRSKTARNQFPFTPKLLIDVIKESGLSLTKLKKVSRSGPELWAEAIR